jgi:hypothetical protein
MITKLKGELEIDHDRGVIYFHTSNKTFAKKANAITILRICQLPTPIPEYKQLDITHMFGVDWSKIPSYNTPTDFNQFLTVDEYCKKQ